jgi:hypothetical protein
MADGIRPGRLSLSDDRGVEAFEVIGGHRYFDRWRTGRLVRSKVSLAD